MIILMNVDCYFLLRVKVRFARLMMRYITKLLHMHMSLYEDYILLRPDEKFWTNFWLLSEVSTGVFLLLPRLSCSKLWQELFSFIFGSTY